MNYSLIVKPKAELDILQSAQWYEKKQQDLGEAYQISHQEMPNFLTFLVEGWADVFSRKVYWGFILENLTYCRNRAPQDRHFEG
jgi:hypothetical protein